MKNILLPIQDNGMAQVAFDTALSVAGHFNSHIEGLFTRVSAPVVAAGGDAFPGVFLPQLFGDGKKFAIAARQQFSRRLKKRHMTLSEGHDVTDRPTAGWREAEGLDYRIIAEYARLFDVTVLTRGKKSGSGWMDVCESALFESGRPVLVAGKKAPQRLSETVVIAWNCSTECARTVALGMPLLTRAKAIHVVTMEAITVPGPSGEEMANRLRQIGVPIFATSIKSDDAADAGAAVLEHARKLGADLLLKSAYTQGRLRQIIFGGATRHILRKAELPVLMAH